MNSMTTDDTYNGYANRETWAFNLHWQNDQGLYNETLDQARWWLEENDVETGCHDSRLGEYVVAYWRDGITEYESGGGKLYDALRMMRDEVGSWWRIDYAEVGSAVRESLDAES